MYEEWQIEAARQNATLDGFIRPTREQAIEFLDWYFANKTEFKSVLEAMGAALSGQGMVQSLTLGTKRYQRWLRRNRLSY